MRPALPILSLALLLGAAPACATVPPPPAFTGEAWVVETIAGEPAAGRRPVTLRFEEGGRMGGQGPCNVYGGNWSITEGRLVVSSVFSTMMACPPPALPQERAMFQVLETARAHHVTPEGTLVIEGGDGAQLVARRPG